MPPLRASPQNSAAGWARPLTLAVLALGFCLVLAADLPGHLSYDSVQQLLDGRTGRYRTWHPPLMAWLLGAGDAVMRGTGLYVALQALVFFGALAALAGATRRASPLAAPVALLLCLSPLVLVWQGVVWKDVLFADLMVAGFVSLHLALTPGRRAPFQAGLTGLAFLMLGAAALVRQNGILALGVGALALAHGRWVSSQGLEPARTGRARLLRAVAPAALALIVTLAGMLLVQQALFRRAADAEGPRWQLNMLQAYDLVGAVARDPGLPLDRLSPPTAAMIRAAARERYTPARNDALLNNGFEAAARRADSEIGPQWRDLLRRHPGLWLAHRAEVFRWQFTTPDLEVCHADATGVDGPADELAALGLKAGQSPRDLGLEAYAGGFHATPVYSHPAYALAALFLALAMFRSRRREDAVIGFLLVAALLFSASFAVIGVACDYRYLYPLDLATMAAGFYAALRFGPLRSSGSGGADIPA